MDDGPSVRNGSAMYLSRQSADGLRFERPRYQRKEDGNHMSVTFADIDGTLVHYPGDTWTAGDTFSDDQGEIVSESMAAGFHLYMDKSGRGHKVMLLPPNTSGKPAIISIASQEAFSNLRNRTSMTVIITGARSSTLLARLPYLPKADAYVSEGGGRIWWHDHTLPTACCIAEDHEWRSSHSRWTGPAEQDAMAPENRQGSLWDAYRFLQTAGFKVDARDYSTAFRVMASTTADLSTVQEKLDQVSTGLTCNSNLGHVDVYPQSSGKDKAAEFLMRRMAAEPAHCRVLCDDDNDLKMAAAVGHVYVVSITHSNVREAINAEPEKFTVAKAAGILATEEMLAAVRDELNTFKLG